MKIKRFYMLIQRLFSDEVIIICMKLHVDILPSSVKPQQQPQLPAAAKLAELQPYFAFHPPPPPTPPSRASRF